MPRSNAVSISSLPRTLGYNTCKTCRQAEQARLAAVARDQELLKGLQPVVYPSKAQLEAGMEEPSQMIGDYSLTRSEHETGRLFSSVKDLGAPGGVSVGEEVCHHHDHHPFRAIPLFVCPSCLLLLRVSSRLFSLCFLKQHLTVPFLAFLCLMSIVSR